MTTETAKFVARRVAPEVDIWDLFCAGFDIGILTRFPGEGPMATVRFMGEKRTVSAPTLHGALALAKEAYNDMAAQPDDEYIPDEDGSEAFARMLERRAETAWNADGYDDLPW